jgi:hypothetical protein
VTASSRAGAAAAALLVVSVSGACGKSGPPLPPLRPVPGRIADAALQRIDDRIEIRYTVPAANADGSTPAAVERVEIYGLAQPAATPAPTIAQLTDPKNLKSRVTVRRPPKEEKAGEAPPPTTAAATPAAQLDPLPGEARTFQETIAPNERGADAPVRYYVVVGVRGRDRRGQPSSIMSVPLSTEPAAPTSLAVTNDEKDIKVTWSGPEGAAFRVYDPAHPDTPISGAAPLQAAAFMAPVTFGAERCFVVRAVKVLGATTVVGPPSEPACATPVDTFPPPAPDELRAIAEDGAVALSWNAMTAADLGGYLVLRGEGSGDTLLPLMTAPIDATSFRDTAVTRGTTYTYVVVAVDASPRHNQSAHSNRQTVTVR